METSQNISQTVTILAVLITAVMIMIVCYELGRFLAGRGNQERRSSLKRRRIDIKDVAYYEDKICTLNSQVERLNEFNERYLSFTEHLSDVVKQLYSSLSAKEISSTVVRLARDIFNTEIIEMYIYDHQERILSKVNQLIKTADEQTSYTLGEGLIGSAAQDGIMKIKGVTYTETNLKNYGQDTSKFWMVAPIHFHNRLIGVLGIGKVKNPTGNERNLMKIICDIAGVTLANQSYLKEWKHGSMKDSLTGLYNRRYMKHVEKSVVRGFPISICMFDIDHFKNYNDTNGHQKGDILLRELSDLISRLSRRDSVLAR
jgi:predicted signal transduction protein with EAL and GGDEF domain